MEEPVAAARAWLTSTGQKLSDHVIVCDVGGGTTDLALLRCDQVRFEPVPEVPPTGFSLGGNDIDEAILTHLLDQHPTEEDAISKCRSGFLVKIRRIKEILPRQQRSDVTLSLERTVLQVPRAMVVSCVAEFVEQVVKEMKCFWDRCTTAVQVKDCPILLVGGGSRLPGLKEAIEALALGKVYQWNHGDYATVLGEPNPLGLAGAA